uniref:Cytochrome b5 heme-binding domain-containing protein n=1 Tax=Arcella intermedia TaxID=1963864 RepID=A0A6B2LHT5_9EUKA
MWTEEELVLYDGLHGKDRYLLAILGEVFDVTKGLNHYGVDKSYHFFTGKDGTRAFVTGEFNKNGLIADVTGLSVQDMVGIEDWLLFYRKDYVAVGKLIGHYYDEQGNPKPSLLAAQEQIQKGHAQQDYEKQLQQKFPGCNSRWGQAEGKTLWCSDKSGGIDRSWTGVLRIYKDPTLSDPERCVCVRQDLLDDPHLFLYDGCSPTASECHWKS